MAQAPLLYRNVLLVFVLAFETQNIRSAFGNNSYYSGMSITHAYIPPLLYSFVSNTFAAVSKEEQYWHLVLRHSKYTMYLISSLNRIRLFHYMAFWIVFDVRSSEDRHQCGSFINNHLDRMLKNLAFLDELESATARYHCIWKKFTKTQLIWVPYEHEHIKLTFYQFCTLVQSWLFLSLIVGPEMDFY